MKRVFLPLLVSAALVPAAAIVSATTVVHMDTRALATRSSDIVIGTVAATRTYWSAERTRVLTDVTLQVQENLKGSAGGELVLTQPGGELDGFRYEIPGAPGFREGEETLVFVWRDAAGRAQVNGLAQGKFEIRSDARSGERLVARSASGLGFADARTLAASPAAGGPSRVTLAELKAEIRRALAEGGGR